MLHDLGDHVVWKSCNRGKQARAMTEIRDAVPPLRLDVITLFPEFFTSPLESGLIGKALARSIAEIHLTNPRDFTTDKHHRVDDEPYGGRGWHVNET
jgi:hypothetical protein